MQRIQRMRMVIQVVVLQDIALVLIMEQLGQIGNQVDNIRLVI